MARGLYFIGRALRHIRRSPFVASVTVGTVAIVFIVLGVFALLGHNLDRLAERLQAGLYLAVYLEDGIEPAQLQLVRTQLEDSPLVEDVRLIPREEALDVFRKRLGPQSTILDGLEDNPLPASFEATISGRGRDSASVGRLAQAVVETEGVEQVQYGQAWLDWFFSFLGLARMAGLVIGSLIVFATLLIVSNTIRLSVFARRDEIHILKLVGATDRFVKVPFYFEGILLGTLGAAVGVGATWLLYALVAPEILIPMGPGIGEMEIAFLPLLASGLMVAGGAVIGLLGTLTSLWRHLGI